MFLVTDMQLLSDERASDITLPAIGILPPIKNFAVLEKAPSAEDETIVPRPIIPEKTVTERVSTHVAKDFTDLAIFSTSNDEKEPATQRAR